MLGFVAVLAWLIWAQMILCLIIETAAEIRIATGRSAAWMSRIPGTFTSQQQLARLLVQTTIAIGVGAEVTVAPFNPSAHTASATTDHATNAEAVNPVPGAASAPHQAQRPPTAAQTNTGTIASNTRRTSSAASPVAPGTSPTTGEGAATTDSAVPGARVTVARGDTLWSIAESRLGSGERWREIAVLNRGRQMPGGARFESISTIEPGWDLLLPTDPSKVADKGADQLRVRTGDTLWGLAEDTYGDGTQWPRIFEANRDQVTDPDLIHPGQVLNAPAARASNHRRPKADPSDANDRADSPTTHHRGIPSERTARPQPAAPPLPPAPERTSPDIATNNSNSPPSGAQAPDTKGDSDTHPGRTTLVAALVGGGSLLGGGLLLALKRRRLEQLRNRRSGRAIAPTPEHLIPIERTLRTHGSTALAPTRFLDLALRSLCERLSAAHEQLPEIRAARLSTTDLQLLLSEATTADTAPTPVTPPAPWRATQDGARWHLSRTERVDPSHHLAPYPTLVAIGTDIDGATWFLDLEAADLVQLTGGREPCGNVARFMAAELAVNTWSDDVDVAISGLGSAVAGFDPRRIHDEPQLDIEALTKTRRRAHEAAQDMRTGVLQGRLDGVGADTWMPSIAIATAQEHDRDALDAYVEEASPDKGRDPVALVILGPEPPISHALEIAVDTKGALAIPQWDLRLIGNQLTHQDAEDLAALFAAAENDDQPMPNAQGSQPHHEVADAAGAIRRELTQPRDQGGASLLPEPDERYIINAATTEEDLAALAPGVPIEVQQRITRLDPTLDEDLVAWADKSNPRPRVRVLGPVEVQASGERNADIDRRLAYYTEIVTYLSTRDHGATPEQVAAGFGVRTTTIHTRIGAVRRWLGTDPVTDDWYLPESTRSPAAQARGVAVYQLVGTLSDADLFVRLRTRAQGMGEAGIQDLVRALELVEGEPFSQQRPGGYGWLAETPEDQYVVAAIVDVAHIVAAYALSSNDARLALWASERAIAAAPSDEKPRLDHHRALTVSGSTESADEYLQHAILNTTEGTDTPTDLPARHAKVLRRQGPHA